MPKEKAGGLIPLQTISQNADSALQFVDTIGDSFFGGGVPGCSTKGMGRALALTCLCEGITPMEFNRTYHLIDGRPSMRADAMLAEFKRLGGKWKWLDLGDEGKEARADVKYEENELEVVYTFEQANRAKLVKAGGAWEKDPGAMLRARLISRTIRAIAPEVVAGVYTPEETAEWAESNGQPSNEKTEVVQVEVKPDRLTVTSEPADVQEVVVEPVSVQPTAKAETAAVEQTEPESLDDIIRKLRDVTDGFGLRDFLKAKLKEFGRSSARAFSVLEAKQVYLLCLEESLVAEQKLPDGKLAEVVQEKAGVGSVRELDEAWTDKLTAFLEEKRS